MPGKHDSRPPLAVVGDAVDDADVKVETVLRPSVGPTPVRPQLRADLVVTDGPGDTVMVKAPEAATAFPIYRMEWRIAQLLDGRRDLVQIAADMGRQGIPGTPEMVRVFVRELSGYRFLQASTDAGSTAALDAASTSGAVAMTDEERQLLSTATALRARGDAGAAVSYLLALLEINPANHYVRDLLREVQAEAASDTPKRDTWRANDPPVQAAASALRPKRWLLAALAVTVLAGGGAVGVWALRGSKHAPAEPPSKPSVQAPQEWSFRLELSSYSWKTVDAPSKGVVFTIDARAGEEVAAGQKVLQLADVRSYGRLRDVEQELERVRGQAKKDSVYRYFLERYKKRLEKRRAQVKTTPVVSPAAGKLELKHAVGEEVDRGQPLFRVAGAARLRAGVPVPPDALPQTGASCVLRTAQGAQLGNRCTLERQPGGAGGTSSINVVVDNAAGNLAVGDTVDVTITALAKQEPAGR